jgi:hypothetical protein
MTRHLAFACATIAAALTTPVFADTGSAGDISIETIPFVGSATRTYARAGIPKGNPDRAGPADRQSL